MTKEIMIVGEAFGEREEKQGKPFVGPSGGLLNAFLSASGIARNECYLTNVFNFRPTMNKVESLCGPKHQGIPGLPPLRPGKYVRREYKSELDRLQDEINSVNPNVILALGATATWALLGDSRIKKLRGAPALTRSGHKVLPTYHPAAVLREYKLRPIVFSDFGKAAKERAYRDIIRPARELWLEPTLQDLEDFNRFVEPAPLLSVDIETWAGQITCIGIGPSEALAIVIPFVCHSRPGCNYWPTLEEELKVWAIIRTWLGAGKGIIGQNFLYDAGYLWSRYGIPIFSIEGDTMLTHHAQQPEMEKSLGFLGSIHTSEPSWKFMRKDIKTVKKED